MRGKVVFYKLAPNSPLYTTDTWVYFYKLKLRLMLYTCLWRAVSYFWNLRLLLHIVHSIEGKLVFNQFAPRLLVCYTVWHLDISFSISAYKSLIFFSFLLSLQTAIHTHFIYIHYSKPLELCHLQSNKTPTNSCLFLIIRPVLDSPGQELSIHTSFITIRSRFLKGFFETFKLLG